MGVPADIRAVPRPTNTIVVDSGRETVNRYAVLKRAYVKYIPKGNPQPRNGKVVGHIINYKYVPIPEINIYSGPTKLQYGLSTLIKNLTEDVYEDLLKIFPASHAASIMAIASLKIIHKNCPDQLLSTNYKRTFLTKYFPGVPLSKNFVSTLYGKIGMDDAKREEFYKLRIARVENDHHVLIDGMLKTDNSILNDLSRLSFKSKNKKSKYISIMYAYDVELEEPVCAQVFAGNKIDTTVFPAFLKKNHVERGVLIGDKAFPKKKILEILKEYPDIGYLFPLKNNDKRISQYNMTKFDGIIKGIRDIVYYKKVKISDRNYLYSFRNQDKSNEQANAFGHLNQKNEEFDAEQYEKKYMLFGVIVFESDIDVDPKTAYKSYANRWLIELVFKSYKHEIELETTNTHTEFNIIGEEFVNFISILTTCRMVHLFDKKSLLDEYEYGKIISFLKSAWRKVDAPPEASSDDKYWDDPNESMLRLLEKLDLSKPKAKPEPKRRGRPRKEQSAEQPPKRPAGRPRKNPEEEPKPKRPVGRPRKNPSEAPQPKRPVGRPRKNPHGEQATQS